MTQSLESSQRPIERLLPTLANVRETAPDRWLASCPTAAHEHGDRHPSLSVRELPDGVVLLRCYSMQCDARSITDAVGLELRDLFPNRVTDRTRLHDDSRLPLRDCLLIVRREMYVVLFSGEHLCDGVVPSDADRDRLRTAVQRIADALDAAGVKP